jgi:putative Holliday junction resolvase
MPLLDLDAFAAALPARGALAGLDPGEKRIGFAVSDANRRLASPVAQVARGSMRETAAALMQLFESRACVAWVVGLPLNMDASFGPAAQSARAFARNLLQVRDAPCLLWDERLSTAAVTRTLIALDTSRAKRAARVDMHAAAYLLQGALDRLQAYAPNGTSE